MLNNPLRGHELSESREDLVPSEQLLEPNERVEIDTLYTLPESVELLHDLNVTGRQVASVNAGGKNFLIVDARNTGVNADFYILDDSFSAQDRHAFKGVREYSPVVIGRNHYQERFSYPPSVSRDHFSVTYEDGELFIQNLEPTNTTSIRAHLKDADDPRNKIRRFEVIDNRTEDAEKRIGDSPNFGRKDGIAPYGYYLNHPVLGRDSLLVDGGVYLGGTSREAIVVDGRSEIINNIYSELAADLESTFQQGMGETLSTEAILLQIMHKVQEVMPYNMTRTSEISQQHHGDRLVGLSTYINAHAGVCRHQSLLAAYLTERLIKDGFIPGSVGVERNTVEVLGGTHAWAVYKTRHSGADKVIVIDPAQGFVGTKSQAQREGRWEYRLSTDKY